MKTTDEFGMTIASLSSPVSSYAISTTSRLGSPAAGGTSQVSQDSPAQISKLGKFMQQLQDLLQSDPEKFKEIASQISDRLNAAAQQASDSGDSNQASMLSDLANKFSTASQNGEMPDLRPAGGPQGRGTMGPPPPPPPTGADESTTSAATGSASNGYAAAAYASNAQQTPMATLESILESVFSPQN